jgi:hypothetical protein
VVGGVDPFASLKVINKGADGIIGTADDAAGAVNVTFDREVTVAGDMTIWATGVVTFKSSVVLTSGNLTIKGASQIVFEQGVTVQGGGDIFLEGNEVDFKTGTESVVGTGKLTIRPSTTNMSIELASPPMEQSDRLNITLAEVQSIADGFSEIIIGRKDSVTGHAEAGTGAVRIGANTVEQQFTFRDKLSVYGGSIEVSDYTNPAITLVTADAVTLDAVGNISINNKFTLKKEATYYDLTLYSENGKISQEDNSGDLVTKEPIYAKNLFATAQTGIDMRWIDVDTITATNEGSGNVDFNIIAEGGNVSVLKIAQTSAADSGYIKLTTENGNITVDAAGTGVTTAGTGAITLDANDTGTDKTLTINKAVSGTVGTITLEADGTVTTNAVVSNSGAGAVTVKSNNSAISQVADITTAGGLITYTAGTSITMTSGTKATAGASGAIEFTAGTNIALSILDAGSTVSLTATAGAISDNLTGEGATDCNIKGTTTTVYLEKAKNGIGTSAPETSHPESPLFPMLRNSTAGDYLHQEADGLSVGTDRPHFLAQ